MLRFVVLIHDHPALHWDFMLEKEAALRTWRLDRPPTEAGPIPAEAIANHRLAYLDYEGPVSGGRGTVTAFDRGEYSLLVDDGHVVAVELRGTRLEGFGELKRLPNTNRWEFQFTPEAAPS
ncbi:MAG TPA: DNA polymerase ligase N-terminal domain-containing protein [Planctomycetaceae bacterium]